MRRIAVAGLFHESNTSVRRPTRLADFRVLRGGELADALTGTQTVCGGFLAAIPSAAPVVHSSATPAGVVERGAYRALVDELCAGLRRALPVDGALLELHGAMVAEGVGAADAETARRVRAAVGDAPLGIVIDPHANLAPGLVASADLVLAYRTNPHVDMAETGERAAAALLRILDGRPAPATAVTRVPVTAPAIAQATADEPLRSILARARAHERAEGGAAVSVLFGFAYADVPEQSMAVVAASDRDRAAAAAAVADVAAHAWSSRRAFARTLETPAGAVAIAARSDGLTALANVGDNVGGGAPGDSTAIASELLRRSDVPAATTICDPAAVAACAAAGAGATVTVAAGTPPLRLTGTVVRVQDGRYVNEGPLARGVTFDMGRVAVVACGSLIVVLQSRAVMANDRNMLRSCGVDVDSLVAVDLKGAAAVRAGWAGSASRFVDVDTPGPTAADLTRLDLRRVRRPLWPLDDFEWRPPRPATA
jgi:microcystin degradation protein MlrC